MAANTSTPRALPAAMAYPNGLNLQDYKHLALPEGYDKSRATGQAYD
jgi:hypothetical protein